MRRLIVLLIATMAATPGLAQAQRCEAPPGTSAVDQYCEAIPDANGTQSAQDARSQEAGTSGALDARATRALEAEGADGQAVLGIASRSSSAGSIPIDSEKNQGGGAGSSETAAAGLDSEAAATPGGEQQPSANPLRAVTSAVTNGDVMGQGFAWILVAIAVLALGGRWIAFRSR